MTEKNGGGMAQAAGAENYYRQKGLKTRQSLKRHDTEAGRLAGHIIGQIPDGFDVYEDSDINERHLAEAIVSTCGRWIRHCPQIGWMAWRPEDGCWTERYAESAVQEVITHFGNLLWEGTAEIRQGEVSFARRILSSAGISAIMAILKRHPRIAVEQDQFDSDGDLLNCKGDLYNLREGTVRRAEPEDLLSQSMMCKAAPLQRRPDGEWEMPEVPKEVNQFLRKITSKDGVERPDLALFILFFFGYALTGDTGASFFLNFHGQGANGKSVLMMTMLKLFGDYAMALPKDLVIENRFASQFLKAGLAGKRLAMLIDAPEGRLNMDELKSISSGEEINAPRKFLKDVDFSPICKMVIGSNPKLTLKDTGMSSRRRIRLVPFDYTVPESEQESHYHKHLLKEAPQLLSLLIYFAHEYFKRGGGAKAFPRCETVDAASKEYMDSEDLVGRWKEERTEAAPKNEVSATDLYKDFSRWAEAEGVRKKMSRNKFGEHLIFHKLEKKRDNAGVFYLNIKLKASPDDLPGIDSG